MFDRVPRNDPGPTLTAVAAGRQRASQTALGAHTVRRVSDVRLGLIGCGAHLARRLPFFTGATVAAVADPNADARSTFAPAARGFADHREMLDSVDLDGVVVASPHGLHFRHTSDALGAGCGVLVYKPMVTSSSDAVELERLALATGRVVSLAIEGLFTAEFRQVRELRDRGELGEIRLVTGLCAQRWLANVRGTWRTDPALGGGGNLIDSGYHMLAALLDLTGQRPTEVCAYLDRRDEQVDLEVVAAFRLDGGAVGSLAVSGDSQGMEEGIYLSGTRSSLTTSIYGQRLAFVTGWSERDVPSLEPAETAEENFVRCIRGEAETLAGPRLGVDIAHFLEAIVRSAEDGRPVRVAR